MTKLLVLIFAIIIFGQTSSNSELLKIIQGKPARPGQFPFLASLKINPGKKHMCGAAIINERWVLSAAHCIDKMKIWEVSVYVGSVYLNSGGSYFDIEYYKVHPRWYSVGGGYDISVIKVTESIKYNKNVQPISLPFNISVKPRDEATVVGWGLMTKRNETVTGILPNQLQYLESRIVDHILCTLLLPTNIFDQQMLCFGIGKESGVCSGDSGGPLIYEANNKSYLIGVVSFGFSCAHENRPDVYTRVSYYIPWIQKQISE